MPLLRHPFISYTIRFLARLAFAGMWGVVLSPADLNTKLLFATLLAVLASGLMVMFFGSRPRLHQVPLYGLVSAGEALGVGAIALALLGASTGQLAVIPLCICTFGGLLLTLYSTHTLYKDIITEHRDQSK